MAERDSAMTVKEILYSKYLGKMKAMNKTAWDNLMNESKSRGIHPAQIMYMGLEITENDIRANGGWNGELYESIKQMHKQKLLASNAHRQYHGQVTAYWLTEKGWRLLNKGHAIC